MKLFYKSIRLDRERLRFYYECECCGKRTYGEKLPLICRGVRTLARCELSMAGRRAQKAYNRAKLRAHTRLILNFNLCQHCFKFVCDGCFDASDDLGACRDCARKSS